MKKFGFTLAEVLIALGVIGVIAAISLPIIIKNYQKTVTVSKLKKFYAIANQSFLQAQQDNGDYAEWDKIADISRQAWFDKYIKPYYKSAQLCKNNYANPCGYDSNYPWKYRGGERVNHVVTSVSTVSFITNDGVLVVWPDMNDASNCFIRVDINNNRNPNTLGYDVFYFLLKPDRKFIDPYGKNQDEAVINDSCINGGTYCAAKIMRDGWKIKDDYKW